MSKASKSYDQATLRIARWLSKTNWSFESFSGVFAPGSSGEVPIPLKPDEFAPYVENFSRRDNIVSYELNQKGRDFYDISFTNLGSGQVSIVVTSAIPGVDPSHNSEQLIGSVNIKPNARGSFKNTSRFTVEAQGLQDGDGTTGWWTVSGLLGSEYLTASGRERGEGGLVNNIEALIAPQSLLG